MFSFQFIQTVQSIGIAVLVLGGFYMMLFGIPNWMTKRAARKDREKRAAMTTEERTADDIKTVAVAAALGLAFIGLASGQGQQPAKQPQRPGKKPSPRKPSAPVPDTSSSINDWWLETTRPHREAAGSAGTSSAPASSERSAPSSRPSQDTLLIGRDGGIAHRITDSLFGDDRLVVGNDGRVSHRVVDSFDGNDKLFIGNDGRIDHRVTDSLFGDDKLVLGRDGQIEYRIVDALGSDDKLAIANDGSIAYRITD